MDFSAGQRLGRYTIEDLLGEGGMGRVYRAMDHQLERRVALKVLRTDAFVSDADRSRGGARLLREARIAATLDHVNAVTIHDVGELEGQPFIAMELVDGRSLRGFVGDKSVSVATRTRWLVDVARALAAAHARGLVHRDVKPENVMLRKDGVIKVLDFGIARRDRVALTAEEQAAEKSERSFELGATDSAIAGTPRYMAPEQILGEAIDARIDQFAWGVVAYELLSGRPPFEGSVQSLSMVIALVSDEPVSMEPLTAVCTKGTIAVVARALSKRRDDRFASMNELLDTLQPGPITLPDVQEVASAPPPPRHPEKKRRWLAAPAAIAVVLAAFAGWRATRPALPLKMTDVASRGVSPVANATYLEAITLIHDASVVPGVRTLKQALGIEPSLVEARVRLLAYGRKLSEVDERVHFEKAWSQREGLSNRDRALLEALSPLYLAVPPDETETTKRLQALAAKNPLDAELGYLAAEREGDPVKLVPLLDRVLTLDPAFSLAQWRKSVTELSLGHYDSALSALDQCIKASAAATACFSVRVLIEEETGRCEAMEGDARVLQARSPSARTHDWLARVLLARGAPLASVRDVLERKWASASDAERPGYQLTDEEHLAIAAGDFATAEARALSQATLAEPSTDEEDHKSAAWTLVELYTEMGDSARAATIADRHLRARSAWQSIGPWSMLPIFLSAAARGGLRTADEVRLGREDWMKTWDTEPLYFRPQSWLFGYAEPATTEADAREALSLAPAVFPRPQSNQFNRLGIGDVGKVLLLAGRAADALPHLERAASTCSVLSAPLAQTHAHLFYGQALEAAGRAKDACAEYAVVVKRWGAFEKSVSATAARAHQASLHCE